MEGKLLGDRYLLQQQLGHQVGRKTFLSLDKLATDITHNSVVVKLLSLGNDFSWQHLKLFTREAETLKKLTHPAIPRYLDYLEIDEPDFKGFALVQTYIEAENLEQHLKTGRTFSEGEVKQIAQALLDTLIYLQSQNPAIIHRDIKPSNILLANRSGHQVGDVYLVDFGSVQNLAAQEGSTITVVGTYGYMPPEQFGGRTNSATDLYGLGATLIYLATGRHPTELPQENMRIQFASFANLSPAFSDWLGWMTEPSLEQRLATATQALEALNNQEIRESTTSANLAIEPLHIAVSKPNSTNISCTKNQDHIEFIIPTTGWGFILIGLLGFTGISLVGISTFLLIANYTIATYIFFHASLCIWLAIVAAVLIYFGRITLRIDRSKITLEKGRWRFKINMTPPGLTNAIQSIRKRSRDSKKDRNGNPIRSKTRLEIVAGQRKYCLSSGNRLSNREIDWIAAELSDWLKLPIDID